MMLSMENTETYTVTRKGKQEVYPIYTTSKGNRVVFRIHGWHRLDSSPNVEYSQDEVDEIWNQWILYWKGL